MMYKNVLIIFIIISFIGCHNSVKQDNKISGTINQELPSNDSIGNFLITSLIDSGFIINPVRYIVEVNINRRYKEVEIPLKLYATFELNGYGFMDSLIFNFNKKQHIIRFQEYYVFSPLTLIEIKKLKDYKIKFADFNFDNQPDLAIYNIASGMKNISEDIYLFNVDSNSFVYNNFLSNYTNWSIDSIHKTLYTWGQGGMASLIYNSATYKWKGSEPIKIEAIEQDYIESRNIFVKKIKVLKDTSWITSIDTLTMKEMQQ